VVVVLPRLAELHQRAAGPTQLAPWGSLLVCHSPPPPRRPARNPASWTRPDASLQLRLRADGRPGPQAGAVPRLVSNASICTGSRTRASFAAGVYSAAARSASRPRAAAPGRHPAQPGGSVRPGARRPRWIRWNPSSCAAICRRCSMGAPANRCDRAAARPRYG
jgi:hypothetical protein